MNENIKDKKIGIANILIKWGWEHPNKKAIKELYDLLKEAYEDGYRDSGNKATRAMKELSESFRKNIKELYQLDKETSL